MMLCPNCQAQMTALSLDGHLGRSVGIEICNNCQAFWFDKYESLQLTEASVSELFGVIKDASQGKPAVRLSLDARCPRCDRRLRVMHDMQKSTRFEYRGCPNDHGRLITFFNFLREKNFIKPLSQEQIDELRKKLRTVNCSNCGAPVDLAHRTICEHCDSPLSMVEWKAPE